eukprot:5345677-Pyramimonas_sp.AAC.2
MQTLPLEPSVELPIGPRAARGVRRNGRRRRMQALPLEPSMSSSRGREARGGVPKWAAVPRASPATGAFCGPPCGGASRVRCVLGWAAVPRASPAAGAF